MPPDKSLFAPGQPVDKAGMNRTKPHDVTLAQWAAVLAVWGLVAYGALAHAPAPTRRDQVRLIACR
ncbi:hypothetical protein ASD21_09175 [Caulobacter sp. Root1455]|nr:hypothetical protein ASD21_09175 [Caulobacter sp. Root1455]